MFGINLERLFRTPGQIAVLRTLWKSPTTLTGRQVQSLAGVSNRTAMLCLADLESLGVLSRRTAGRAHLYEMKRGHQVVRDLIAPVFKAEDEAPERFIKTLARILEGRCLSAVIYGSVARGEADSTSDVDILVVVRDKQDAEFFAQTTQPKAEERHTNKLGDDTQNERQNQSRTKEAVE